MDMAIKGRKSEKLCQESGVVEEYIDAFEEYMDSARGKDR